MPKPTERMHRVEIRIGRRQARSGAPGRRRWRCIQGGMYGATSNAHRESEQLDPKFLAEDTASQHERYKGQDDERT